MNIVGDTMKKLFMSETLLDSEAAIDNQSIKIVIFLASIALLQSLFYSLVLFFVFHAPAASAIDLSLFLLYPITYLLIRNKWLTSAKLWVSLLMLSQLSIGTIFLIGKEGGFHFYLLLFPPVMYLIFPFEGKLIKLFFSLIGMGLFFVCEYVTIDDYIVPIPPMILRIIYISNICFIGFGMFFVVKIFYDNLIKSHQEQKRLAITDPLTGLFNRRFFFIHADRLLYISRRYAQNLSIIIIDIDHFKRINDIFGHSCGDFILRQVSNILLETVRKVDILARYGGEEFILLLPQSDTDQTEVVAERLRSNIENSTFDFKNEIITITVSIGISGYTDEPDLSLEKIFSRCDRALYDAKENGRNQVRVWRE